MKENLHIGGIDTGSQVVLAPMAGFTDFGFRSALRTVGFPGLFVTELLSCRSIYEQKDRKLKTLLHTADSENPISWQIFGYEPEFMAFAAKWLQDNRKAAIIDINMGCSVPKVLKRGAGSGLLKDLECAEANLRAVIRAVDVPVTVKMRLGWENDPGWLREAVLLFQDAGASIICLHARKPQQGFKGEADWIRIAKIKDVLDIPVVGNGDIWTVEDGLRMKAETGCDAVMVGRGAIKDPLLPINLHRVLSGDEPLKDVDHRLFMREHLKGLLEFYDPWFAEVMFRKWRGKYPKKFYSDVIGVLKELST